MRWNVFVGTTLLGLVAPTLPALAQSEPPRDGSPPTNGGTPAERPAAPLSSEPQLVEEAPKDVPPAPPADRPSTRGPDSKGGSKCRRRFTLIRSDRAWTSCRWGRKARTSA
ncbi:MAG TPA: hypothetical protein VK550_32575 [Polyangiaceae bacterium]|nr:hypothetical protein [Polyangiaceae bacterium]